jgi:beta-glucanase (GH16 family)
MEHVGFDMGNVHATVHTEAYNGAIGTQKGNQIYIPDVQTNFHLYAVEWSEDTLNFFADDELYFTFINNHLGYTTWPFDKRFHLLMNIAIGGNWGGQQGVDDEIFPQTLEVDYVRVYELFRRHSIQGPAEVNANEENISFSIHNFDGAEYTWSFPEGVAIVSGQGTAGVTVNWGENPGTVSVIQLYEGTRYTSTLDVGTVAAPGDGPLIINSNENDLGTWTINQGSGNTIEMEYEE